MAHNKDVIIEIGFSADIKKFVQDMTNELRKADFADTIGLSDIFSKEVQDLKKMLADIKKDLDTTFNGNISKEFAFETAQRFKNVAKVIEDMRIGFESMSKNMSTAQAEVFSKTLNNMSKQATALHTEMSSVNKVIRDINKSGNGVKIQTASNKTIKKQLEDANRYYRLLQAGRQEAQGFVGDTEEAAANVKKEFTTLVKNINNLTHGELSKKPLVEREKAFNQFLKDFARLDYQFSELSVDMPDLSFDKFMSIYDQLLKVVQQLTHISPNIELDNVDELKTQLYYNIQNLTQEQKELKRKLLSEMGTNELEIPLSISTTRKEFYDAVYEIVNSVQQRLSATPLEVKLVLVSGYATRKNNDILKSLQQQLASSKIKMDPEFEGEIRQSINKISEIMEKDFKQQIDFTINVKGEKAQSEANDFIRGVKKTIEEESPILLKVTPEIVIDGKSIKNDETLSNLVKEIAGGEVVLRDKIRPDEISENQKIAQEKFAKRQREKSQKKKKKVEQPPEVIPTLDDIVQDIETSYDEVSAIYAGLYQQGNAVDNQKIIEPFVKLRKALDDLDKYDTEGVIEEISGNTIGEIDAELNSILEASKPIKNAFDKAISSTKQEKEEIKDVTKEVQKEKQELDNLANTNKKQKKLVPKSPDYIVNFKDALLAILKLSKQTSESFQKMNVPEDLTTKLDDIAKALNNISESLGFVQDESSARNLLHITNEYLETLGRLEVMLSKLNGFKEPIDDVKNEIPETPLDDIMNKYFPDTWEKTKEKAFNYTEEEVSLKTIDGLLHDIRLELYDVSDALVSIDDKGNIQNIATIFNEVVVALDKIINRLSEIKSFGGGNVATTLSEKTSSVLDDELRKYYNAYSKMPKKLNKSNHNELFASIAGDLSNAGIMDISSEELNELYGDKVLRGLGDKDRLNRLVDFFNIMNKLAVYYKEEKPKVERLLQKAQQDLATEMAGDNSNQLNIGSLKAHIQNYEEQLKEISAFPKSTSLLSGNRKNLSKVAEKKILKESTTEASNVSDTSKAYLNEEAVVDKVTTEESNKLDKVVNKIREIVLSIDEKNAAFEQERQIVEGVITSEINQLDTLSGNLILVSQDIEKLNQKFVELDNIQSYENITTNFSTLTSSLNELKTALDSEKEFFEKNNNAIKGILDEEVNIVKTKNNEIKNIINTVFSSMTIEHNDKLTTEMKTEIENILNTIYNTIDFTAINKKISNFYANKTRQLKEFKTRIEPHISEINDLFKKMIPRQNKNSNPFNLDWIKSIDNDSIENVRALAEAINNLSIALKFDDLDNFNKFIDNLSARSEELKSVADIFNKLSKKQVAEGLGKDSQKSETKKDRPSIFLSRASNDEFYAEATFVRAQAEKYKDILGEVVKIQRQVDKNKLSYLVMGEFRNAIFAPDSDDEWLFSQESLGENTRVDNQKQLTREYSLKLLASMLAKDESNYQKYVNEIAALYDDLSKMQFKDIYGDIGYSKILQKEWDEHYSRLRKEIVETHKNMERVAKNNEYEKELNNLEQVLINNSAYTDDFRNRIEQLRTSLQNTNDNNLLRMWATQFKDLNADAQKFLNIDIQQTEFYNGLKQLDILSQKIESDTNLATKFGKNSGNDVVGQLRAQLANVNDDTQQTLYDKTFEGIKAEIELEKLVQKEKNNTAKIDEKNLTRSQKLQNLIEATKTDPNFYSKYQTSFNDMVYKLAGAEQDKTQLSIWDEQFRRLKSDIDNDPFNKIVSNAKEYLKVQSSIFDNTKKKVFDPTNLQTYDQNLKELQVQLELISKELQSTTGFDSFEEYLKSLGNNASSEFTSIVQSIRMVQNALQTFNVTENVEVFDFQAIINSLKDLKNATRNGKFGKDINDVIAQIESYSKKIKTENIPIKEIFKQYTDFTKQYKTLVDTMNQPIYTPITREDTTRELLKLDKFVAKNSAMSKEFKDQFANLRIQIETADSKEKLAELSTELLKLESNVVRAGETGKSIFQSLSNRIKQMSINFISMYLSLYDISRYAREAFDVIRNLDTELVDLRKTTTMNTSELNAFYAESSKTAANLGTTTAEIISQASAWSRLGYSSREAATEMAALSSQFAAISPGMDTETAQSGLVSIMKAFNIEPDDVKTEIMDPINKLGNTFAESNLDIVEGLERSSAALHAVGTSFQDSVALFTGAQEIIQNSEKVGTALRSISMRVRGYNESTEELDNNLSTITGDVVELTKTASNPEGISLFTDETQRHYKSLVQYLGELSNSWDEISEKNKNALLQKLFAKTQAQVGSSIISNFDQVRAAIEAVETSAGSADKEMGIVRDSIDFKINEIQQTWVGALQQILDKEDIKSLLDNIITLSDALANVIGQLGVSKVVTGGGVGFGLITSIKSFMEIWKQMKSMTTTGTEITTVIGNIKEALSDADYADLFKDGYIKSDDFTKTLANSIVGYDEEQARKILKDVQGKYSEFTDEAIEQILSAANISLQNTNTLNSATIISKLNIGGVSEDVRDSILGQLNLIDAQGNLINGTREITEIDLRAALATSQLTEAQRDQVLATLLSTSATDRQAISFSNLATVVKAKVTSAFKTMMNSWITAGIAVGAAIAFYAKLMNTQNELNESAKKVGETFKSENETIDNYKSEIYSLHQTINDSASSLDEVSNARERLLELQNELISNYGTEKDAIQDINDAIDGQTDALNNLNKKAYDDAITEFNKKSLFTKARETVGNWIGAMNPLLSVLSGDDPVSTFKGMLNNYSVPTEDLQNRWGNYQSMFGTISRDVKLGSSGSEKFDKILNERFNGGIITGNVEDVIKDLQKIRDISANYNDINNKFLDKLNNKLAEANSFYESNKDLMKAMIYYQRILNNETSTEQYAKVDKAKEAYDEALKSGNQDDIESTRKKLVELLNSSNVDVVDWFNMEYPALQEEIATWEFKANLKLEPTLALEDIQQDISSNTVEKILNLPEDSDLKLRLTNFADENGFDNLESLLDYLHELGYIRDEQEQLIYDMFGDKIDWDSLSNKEKKAILKLTKDDVNYLNYRNKAILKKDTELQRQEDTGLQRRLAQLKKERAKATNANDFIRQYDLDNQIQELEDFQEFQPKVGLDYTEESTAEFTKRAKKYALKQLKAERIAMNDAWKLLSSDQRKSLLDLAIGGTLNYKTLSNINGVKEHFEDLGFSVKEVLDYINQIPDSTQALSAMKGGITAITSAYSEKKEDKTGTYGAVGTDTLEGLRTTLGVDQWTGKAAKAWENYKNVAGDSEKSLDDLKVAQDKLATAYVSTDEFLAKVDEDSKGYYETQLKEMGVTNAHDIVLSKLIRQNKDNAYSKEFATKKGKRLIDATQQEIDAFIIEQGYAENSAQAFRDLAFQKKVTALMSNDLKNATLSDIEELSKLTGASKSATFAMAQTLIAKRGFNKVALNTEDDVNALIKLGNKAGATAAQLAALRTYKFLKFRKGSVPSEAEKNLDDQLAKAEQKAEEVGKSIQTKFAKIATETESKTETERGNKGDDGSKSGSNSSETDTSQEIDWIARRLQHLQNVIDYTKAKLENLFNMRAKDANYKSQIKQYENLWKSQEIAAKKYYGKAESYLRKNGRLNTLYGAGVSLEKLRTGAIKGSPDELIKKYGEKAANIITTYQGYWDNAKNAEKAAEEAHTSWRETYNAWYQEYVDQADQEKASIEANEELVKSAKEKNKYERQKIKWINQSYKYQIKQAQLEKDQAKVAELRAQRDKEILDIHHNILQNILDENEAMRSYNSIARENATTLAEQDDLYASDIATYRKDNSANEDYYAKRLHTLSTGTLGGGQKVPNNVKNALRKSKVAKKIKNKVKTLIKSGKEIPDSLLKKLPANLQGILATYNTSLSKEIKAEIEALELERDTAREENEKNIRETLISAYQGHADEASTNYDIAQAMEEQVGYASDKNSYESQSREYLTEQYGYLLAIDDANEDILSRQQHILEYREKIQDSHFKELENLQAEYDLYESITKASISSLEARGEYLETVGRYLTEDYYNISNQLTQTNIDNNTKMLEAYSQALKAKYEAGEISSEQYVKGLTAQSELEQNILSDENKLIENRKALNEIKLRPFEIMKQYLEDAVTYTEHIITMLSHKTLTDKDIFGLTDDGLATLDAYADKLNYVDSERQNAYTELLRYKEILDSGDEVGNLEETLSKIAELTQAVNSYTEEYASTVDNLKDLVQEAFDAQLEGLNELISKRKDALQAEKDLYEYQKKVKEQNKDIADIQKQIAALSGDNSDEARMKLQKLNIELKDAQQTLADTEYDQWLQDQEDALDTMSEDFEDFIETIMSDSDSVKNAVIKLVSKYDQLIATQLVANGLSTNQMRATKNEDGSTTYSYQTDDGTTVTVTADANNNITNQNYNKVISDIEGIIPDYSHSMNNLIEGLEKESNNDAEINDTVNQIQHTVGEAINELKAKLIGDTGTVTTLDTSNLATSINSSTTSVLDNISADDIGTITTPKSTGLTEKQKKYQTIVKALNQGSATNEQVKTALKYVGKSTSSEMVGSYKDTEVLRKQLAKEVKAKAGFSHGGIGQLVPSNEDGIAFVRNGEGFIMPEHVKTIQELLNNLPTIESYTRTISTPNTMSASLNVGDINISLDGSNVTDPESFVRTFKQSKEMQKAVQNATIGQISKSYNNKLAI